MWCIDVEEGRDERERLDAVEGAVEARRDMAGEGGAGRLDVSEVEDSCVEDRFGGDTEEEDVISCDVGNDVDASNAIFSGSAEIASVGVIIGVLCSDIVLWGEVAKFE